MDITMKVGMRIPVVGGEPKILAAREAIMEKRCFSQYTDIEALLAILSNKELKANSILNVDDQLEKVGVQELLDGGEAIPYVACFDYKNEENIPLWFMYADKRYGVKLQLELEDKAPSLGRALIDRTRDVKGRCNGQKTVMFSMNRREQRALDSQVCVDISDTLVVYDDTLLSSDIQLPSDNMKNWATLASTKSSAWAFQNEARIIADFWHTGITATNDNVQVVDIPQFDYLLLPITFTHVKQLTVTFSPWMGDNTKKWLKREIESLNLGCDVTLRNSIFDGIITRK